MNHWDVDLSADERDLLAHGLDHWGRPAHAADALARVMGFENVEHLLREAIGSRIGYAPAVLFLQRTSHGR